MWRYLASLLIVSLLAGCQNPNSPNSVASTRPEAALTDSSTTLVVYGMGCPMCANNIDRQLLKVPGVQSVDVDLGTGNIAVKFAANTQPTRQQLVEAVQKSGFTLVEIRGP